MINKSLIKAVPDASSHIVKNVQSCYNMLMKELKSVLLRKVRHFALTVRCIATKMK